MLPLLPTPFLFQQPPEEQTKFKDQPTTKVHCASCKRIFTTRILFHGKSPVPQLRPQRAWTKAARSNILDLGAKEVKEAGVSTHGMPSDGLFLLSASASLVDHVLSNM
jgi:hypothetical protein